LQKATHPEHPGILVDGRPLKVAHQLLIFSIARRVHAGALKIKEQVRRPPTARNRVCYLGFQAV
jgi:hypothetical protein